MSGQIPQDFIQDLLHRVDIVDLIGKRIPLKKQGRNFVACCPFHQEKTPSFNVSVDKQLYHCFGCGESGNAIGFLMAYERLDFVDVIEDLAQSLGVQVPKTGAKPSDPRKKTQLERAQMLMRHAELFFEQQLRQHPNATTAIAYLQKRGLSGAICKQFHIGYAPESWDSLKKALLNKGFSQQEAVLNGLLIEKNGRAYDRFRDRVMFPIKNKKGITVGFGGRVINQGEPKYLNSPETPLFSKSQELYGFYETRQANRNLDKVIIVEGYMDVVALFQSGITTAMATLGTATSSTHIQQMFRVTDNLLFCFDGDRAGKDAAWKALQTCLPFIRGTKQAHFMFLAQGEDPDSTIRKIGTQAFLGQLEQASLSLSEFLLTSLKSQVDLSSLDGKSTFINLAKPLIETITDPVFKALLQENIAAITGADSATLAAPIQPSAEQKADNKKNNQILSPISQAIALCLQFPHLIRQVSAKERDISQLNQSGHEVLAKILETIERNPHISSAQLIALWPPEGAINKHLNKLAYWQRPGTGEEVEREFIDCLTRLRTEVKNQRIAIIQDKIRQHTAETHEKLELSQLLTER